MTEFPGLLPWHFGGDPWLTWTEAKSLSKEFNRRCEEAEKQQREMERERRRAGRGR